MSDMSNAPKTYRLGSSEMVYAPGIIRWAICGFKSDRQAMIEIVLSWKGVSEAAAIALLSQRVPFTVEGETVVFTA
jgi:hypothetical protein